MTCVSMELTGTVHVHALTLINTYLYFYVGALGKRTRYQQTDVAQLVLKVSSTSPLAEQEGGASPAHSLGQAGHGGGVAREFPREISLDDDTLLDKVNLTHPQAQECLNPLQQASLLAWW